MLFLAFTFLLFACTSVNSPTTAAPTENTTAATIEETTTTAPTHAALYLPEYTTQQILEYFEEVVLHLEYTDGTGNATLVQKWEQPIYYRVYGNPTQEDISVLTALFADLNEIPGFPGIYAAADDQPSNLMLNFLDHNDFNRNFQGFLNGENAYGATQFWYYTDTNEIHTADVGYRTDIAQNTRTSVLIEEIINTLGISDTVLRPDSIVYQYSNDNTALSDVDWLILKLLYDPEIQCGMDFDSCRMVIKKLYY